jgi:60 kDa SS-A/Ro ribonucleoprotein
LKKFFTDLLYNRKKQRIIILQSIFAQRSLKQNQEQAKMANKNLFSSVSPISHVVPVADTINAAGGAAYTYTAKHKLAQIAATNCFNGTYYVDASANLQVAKDAVKELRSDPEFVAKVAVYCRTKAYMKDMPAYLCAVLASWGEHKLFRQVFAQVIDNGKMLRNFVQIGRSGAAGKKLNMSSGAVRHAIRDWFKSKNPEFIFRASIGNDPTMRDILRMARPLPETAEKAALYAYLKGAEFDPKVESYITRNKDGSVKIPTLIQCIARNRSSVRNVQKIA